MKELIYFLPLSDNYSARGRPGRNAERGILPDLLSAVLLSHAYERNFTTRVMEGLLLNRFLHLHCERAGYPLRPSGLLSWEEEEAICHDFLWQIFSSACLTYARSNTTFRHADIST